MSTDCALLQVMDGLVEYLQHPATIEAYPRLGGLAVNSFNDPEQTQYPLIDIHPITQTPKESDVPGQLSETATGLLGFVLHVEAAQYQTAIREAFNRADDLRRALNCQRAAQYTGVDWIYCGEVRQSGPVEEINEAVIELLGQIKAGYSIEAR
jgi:hypothetical protein